MNVNQDVERLLLYEYRQERRGCCGYQFHPWNGVSSRSYTAIRLWSLLKTARARTEQVLLMLWIAISRRGALHFAYSIGMTDHAKSEHREVGDTKMRVTYVKEE